MPHGMFPITPFIPTYTSRTFTRFSGTDSYSSHGPGLAPKPSHGTTSAPAKQQELKTKMDIDEIQ